MTLPTSLNEITFGFIGAGNMASAIVRGLLAAGHDPKKIMLSNPTRAKLDQLSTELNVQVTQSNQAVCDTADVLILAVKPQMMTAALEDLEFTKVHCVISVAAGLTTSQLSAQVNQMPVIRSMPNTPAIELQGATGLYADSATKAAYHPVAEYLFGAVGEFVWLEKEDQMDIVTAIAGSSPAYFFYFIEGMIEAAKAQGMTEECAKTLVVQSALGAATLLKNHPDVDIAERRQQVTSPGGTTAAALTSLQQDQLQQIVANAVDAAITRGQELAANH
ncbi:pyrroline-5-carboxylate reductase [Pleionea sp. CnH1-48]|uniref:pyrroline-5-carboxylate reductase n=1 Tax=Pleionea sp. CnH1-48 TaxID=2954494 RepID=UPI0020972964|nr:pyrroline-5-carboxylate reductase [Pleionea sp. CnH1-48]MCO7225270.1 pyrroline-5-carboxylate reductase [Pleionea sp. CnH1-48]